MHHEYVLFTHFYKILAFLEAFFSQTKIYPKNPKLDPPSQPPRLPREYSGPTQKVAGIKKSQNENAI